MEFECDYCNHISEVKFRVTKKPGGLHYVFFRCEHCEADYPSYYTNAKIRKLQEQQVEARDNGEGEKALELFEETRRRMKNLNAKHGIEV